MTKVDSQRRDGPAVPRLRVVWSRVVCESSGRYYWTGEASYPPSRVAWPGRGQRCPASRGTLRSVRSGSLGSDTAY